MIDVNKYFFEIWIRISVPSSPLLSPVTKLILIHTLQTLQGHVVYSPWLSWKYESLLHFGYGCHILFLIVLIIMNFKPFHVMVNRKLSKSNDKSTNIKFCSLKFFHISKGKGRMLVKQKQSSRGVLLKSCS